MLGRMQKGIQFIKPLMKYPNYVARRKIRVFFYRSRDHGRDIMTSFLGSLVHKSLKLTKIMPNSPKLLDNNILSNAPPKKCQ